MDRMRNSKLCSSGYVLVAFAAVALLAGSGCGKKESFAIRPAQEKFKAADEGLKETQSFPWTPPPPQTEKFDLTEEQSVPVTVNPQVDLLLVEDNSSSMDPSQEKLRRALTGFARKYMTSNLDLRAAVITTDAFLASPIFTGYLNSTSRGIRRNQIFPSYGSNYAKLLPGIHDGPITTMCDKRIADIFGDFYYGYTQCWRRDASPNRGPEHCLHPSRNESSITECVNTVNNDTIHSGQPILSTIPGQGETADEAWTQKLIDNFIINASVSTSGSGYERGLGSLTQFLRDNEKDPQTRFFRPGSQRVIVFLSDEDDQTVDDQKLMQAKGIPAEKYSPKLAYTDQCRAKTVDGYSYTLSSCIADPKTYLIPVAAIKGELDQFFAELDKGAKEPGSYFVAAIVAQDGETIAQLQQAALEMRANGMDEQGRNVPLKPSADQDRGRRYMKLVEAVQSGSMSLDIGAQDYNEILANIGRTILKKTTKKFTEVSLGRAPADPERMVVVITHADGTSTTLGAGQYALDGAHLKITDEAVVQALKPQDKIQITYRTRSVQDDSKFKLPKVPTDLSQLVVQVNRADNTSTRLKPRQYRVDGDTVTITDKELLNGLGPNDHISVTYGTQPIRQGQFPLKRAPTSAEQVNVLITHGPGSSPTKLRRDQFRVDGNVLTITDESLKQTLQPSDRVVIEYQPRVK